MRQLTTEALAMLLTLTLMDCAEIDPKLSRIDKILEQSHIQRDLRDLEYPTMAPSQVEPKISDAFDNSVNVRKVQGSGGDYDLSFNYNPQNEPINHQELIKERNYEEPHGGSDFSYNYDPKAEKEVEPFNRQQGFGQGDDRSEEAQIEYIPGPNQCNGNNGPNKQKDEPAMKYPEVDPPPINPPPFKDSIFGDDRNTRPPPNSIFGDDRNTRPPPNSIFGDDRNTRPPPNSIFSDDRNTRPPPNSIFGDDRNTRPPPNSIFGDDRKSRPQPNSIFGDDRPQLPPLLDSIFNLIDGKNLRNDILPIVVPIIPVSITAIKPGSHGKQKKNVDAEQPKVSVS